MVLAPAPPRNEQCSVCGDDFSVPHQANCSHWFCGHCIMGVWVHGSVLQPCKCPLCRRDITLLIPSDDATRLRNEPEIAPVINRIEQYNHHFGGTPCNLIQWWLDQPFYIRRMLSELACRALPLVFIVKVALAIIIYAAYLTIPPYLGPQGVYFKSIVDNLVISITACAYICSIYRAILRDRYAR